MDDKTLATELLHEIKASARRWFIAFCIMVGLEIATVAGFLWYISLPIEEETTTYEQSVDDIEDSDIEQNIGVDKNKEEKGDNE